MLYFKMAAIFSNFVYTLNFKNFCTDLHETWNVGVCCDSHKLVNLSEEMSCKVINGGHSMVLFKW